MNCLLTECMIDFAPVRANHVYCSKAHRDIAGKRKQRASIVHWVRQYKIEKGCNDCNYREHHAALEFDHLETRNADVTKTIAYLVGKGSLSNVQKEIEKCEVVCRNCHGIRTWERNQK